MLPDVSFTNNLGSVSFKRCLVGFTDQWGWDGAMVNFAKTITIKGVMNQDAMSPEGAEGILSSVEILGGGSNSESRGLPGDLVLPWTTLHNVIPSRIVTPDGIWVDEIEVDAQFTDHHPADNLYTLHFFDLILHNPRIQIPTPGRQINDIFVQMPQLSTNTLMPSDLLYGPVRVRPHYEMMALSLSGTILLKEVPGLQSGAVVSAATLGEEDVDLRLAFLREVLSQRASTSVVTATSGMRPGYPRVFDMQDCTPEIGTQVPVRKMFVANSRMVWRVEDGSAIVTINLLAQPQRWW